jgi:hypothetical protein
MTVKYIRLLTGEDLLVDTTLDQSEEGKIKVKNPVRIVMSQAPNSEKINVGLAPWPQFTGSTELSINRAHILFETEPLPEFKDQYTRMFGGLLTPNPNSKLILPGMAR